MSLLAHNIGYIFSSVLTLAVVGFVFAKDHKPFANKMMLLGFLAVAVYTISHVIGVNISDGHLSKLVLMFNTANLFISCFIAHSVFAILGRLKEEKKVITFFYAVSFLLFLSYMISPGTFLLDSVPKLYFPNYYVAGSLHWLMRLFSNVLIPAYFLYRMIAAYKTADVIMRNRLKYLFVALLLGYSFGFTAVPLVYGVALNPVWSIFFVPLFVIPFSYAVFKYDLLDIRIVAKQAFAYSLSVAIVGLLVGFLNFSSNFIAGEFPDFPLWLLPLVSAFLAVSTGFFVWNKIRETDILKHEFMTVITHKFRTPLTHIKWSAENLSKIPLSEENQSDVYAIKSATDHLVGLTTMLVTLSESEHARYGYLLRPVRVMDLLKDVVSEYGVRFPKKNGQFLLFGTNNEELVVLAENARLKAVIQILIDNAISYSPKEGLIGLKAEKESHAVVISVRDKGIGISSEDLPRIFNKFFRGATAKKMDTEGMGIGLFMARRIIEQQGGKIWAESEGEGKGSTFFIKLQAVSR